MNVQKKRYLYSGKELQDQTFGGTVFAWYDYGARFYAAEIDRWYTVDPLAEVSKRWSIYAYCYNNPLRYIDTDGVYSLRSKGVKLNIGNVVVVIGHGIIVAFGVDLSKKVRLECFLQ